jgi:signal transduction histidine kinase
MQAYSSNLPELSMETARQEQILIVDDNPLNAKLLFKFLSRAGFERVSVAADGYATLEIVRASPPDLILLDVMMPGIDGFETCQYLKDLENGKDIPVIFMTALADTEHKLKAFQLGAVDYIAKPFQKEEILARIDVHLKLRSLTQQLEKQNTLLQQSQQELERRVEERTAELSQTVEDLKKTQIQLIHSEKMSSLGQLVAGVAHEVNNPVNFIHGNITHASQYLQDLLELVELYEVHCGEISPEIQDKIEEIDLEFLKDDLPKILSSMKTGTNRIRHIVRSLQLFSRIDEAECKFADLNEGLESTSILMGSRLQGDGDRLPIQTVVEYGNLPSVVCYPGQMNQVFMNILANAIDTLEEALSSSSKPQNYVPTIWIRTEVRLNDDRAAESISIRIADNGLGIPEAIQHRVFDPFFTTKPVGKGTGLGMSVSHSIVVEQHRGKLICNSVLGEGTEFTIEIPVALNPDRSISIDSNAPCVPVLSSSRSRYDIDSRNTNYFNS